MTIRTPLFLVAVVAVLAGPALAQGSGTVCDDPQPNLSDAAPFSVTSSLSGTITHLDRDKQILLVTDERSGQKWAFQIGEMTRLRADKGLFERKQIEWANLRVGQRTRITFRSATQGESVNLGRGVVEIKVRKPKRS